MYQDGKIVYALSEERLSKIKNDSSFPDKSLEKICQIYKLNNSNVEKITVDSQNLDPTFFQIQRDRKFTVDDFVNEQYSYWKPRLIDEKKLTILTYLIAS